MILKLDTYNVSKSFYYVVNRTINILHIYIRFTIYDELFSDCLFIIEEAVKKADKIPEDTSKNIITFLQKYNEGRFTKKGIKL